MIETGFDVMPKILVVDDDPNIAEVIEQYFERPQYEVYTMVQGEKVAETVARTKPDLILLDLKLPDINGMDILKDLKEKDLQAPVIVITGKVSAGVAIEAMKEGAYEYLPKPFRLEELGKLVDKLLTKDIESQTPSSLENQPHGPQETEELVGRSSAILEIGKAIGQATSSDAPILLTGESGTGKELIARMIHRNSRRKDKPFIVVNCAYSSPEMLEQELFGGSGTTEEEAFQENPRKALLSSGGTVFLDDVGSMSMPTQNKLLRVLKTGEIGARGDKAASVGARIIAASAQDLSRSANEGKFVQELFYNLRVISIWVPPLRERKSDIPLLAKYFMDKYCRQNEKRVADIAPDATRLLMSYPWPGNVRELENNLYSGVVMCKGDQILPEHLPVFFEGNPQAQLEFRKGDDYASLFMQILDPIRDKLFEDLKGKLSDRLTASLERALISMALKNCQGSQVKAAALLGMSRNTLRERMLKFRMSEKAKLTRPPPLEPQVRS